MKKVVLLILSIISTIYLFREQIKKLIIKLLRKIYKLQDITIITNNDIFPLDEMNDLIKPILYYKNMKSKKMRSKLTFNIGKKI